MDTWIDVWIHGWMNLNKLKLAMGDFFPVQASWNYIGAHLLSPPEGVLGSSPGDLYTFLTIPHQPEYRPPQRNNIIDGERSAEIQAAGWTRAVLKPGKPQEETWLGVAPLVWPLGEPLCVSPAFLPVPGSSNPRIHRSWGYIDIKTYMASTIQAHLV